jgi:hypothetical protein
MVQKGRPLVVSRNFVQREDRHPRHPRHGSAVCALSSTTSPLLQFVWRAVTRGRVERREAGAKLRIAYRRARSALLLFLLVVLLWFWSSLQVRCVVSVRVRATFNPARYASNAGCHFYKIKRYHARLLTRPYIKYQSSGQHNRSAAAASLLV